ncbi:MAG: hypothetical protein RLZZ91_509 [Bacteroidota bacterium]|jgi:hypothetical protein
MIKKFSFSLLLLFVLSSVVSAQIRWQLKPYQAVGYASNILLSPPILANPGIDTIGKFAIYKRDVFNKIGLTNRFERVNSRGGLLGVNTSLQSINYATIDDIDTYIIKNSIDYKFKVDTDFTFIPRAGIEKTKKLTIDILTDDGVNTYDYWYLFGGSEAYYRVNKKLRIGADIESGWKSYKTMASGRNFTHMQYLLSFEAEYWINKINFLNVGYAFKRYDFKSLESEFIPNALIDWNYNSIFASIKYKIDNDHYLSYATELEKKSDMNVADFSFSQWNNKLVWDWYFHKIGVSGDLQANFRNYKRRTAYTEADTDLDALKLKYNYYTANIKLKYNWSANSMMYAGYSREIRETNSTRLERLYRRPFAFFGFTLGWTYNFNREIARAIPTTNS